MSTIKHETNMAATARDINQAPATPEANREVAQAATQAASHEPADQAKAGRTSHIQAWRVIEATDPARARGIFRAKLAAGCKVEARQTPTMGVYRDMYWYDPAILEAFSSPDEVDALISLMEAWTELSLGLPEGASPDAEAVRARARRLLPAKLADRERRERVTAAFEHAVKVAVTDAFEAEGAVTRSASILPDGIVGIDRLWDANDYIKEPYGWRTEDRLVLLSSGADRSELFLNPMSFRDLLFDDDAVGACLTFADVAGQERCLWLLSTSGPVPGVWKDVLVGTVPATVEDAEGEFGFYEAIASGDDALMRRACAFVADLLLHPRDIEGAVGVFSHEEVAATRGEQGLPLPYAGVSFDYDDIVRACGRERS